MKCIKCGADLPDGALYCPACGKKQTQEPKPERKKTRGNGTGCVYRIGKKWAAEVTLGYRTTSDGKRKRIIKRKKGFSTKAEAILYIPALLQQVEKQQKTTLDELWTFYEANGLTKLSKSKQGHYRTAYNKLQSVSFVDLAALTIKDLQGVVNEKATTYYPAKDMKTLLCHLYDLAVADQLVTVNIAEYIELPHLEEESPNPFTKDEVSALWSDYFSGSTVTGYALLMIYTGMMPGELFELRTDMIDLDNKVICGAGLKTEVRKKAPIVLSDFIVPVIKELLNHANGDKFLPLRRDAYRKEFKAMLERCGCRSDLVPYSCRHTTATSLASAEVALTTIKEVMRHSKVTTTQRYVHITAGEMLAAVNRMAK